MSPGLSIEVPKCLKLGNILCFDDDFRFAITDFVLAEREKLSDEFRTGNVHHMSTGKTVLVIPISTNVNPPPASSMSDVFTAPSFHHIAPYFNTNIVDS
ncbi:hypothetical protein CPB83DRAFT_899329 [Crepidotus variabilis]|uniref:Uncharacterized protein n=1 Tax=Crepidotus variabilis TaxID=179855 RepID=A0A9P6JJ08_9AGAR|nr:hypothetical protein CPB83DRAFT_899329 [Crepidotus variabilis]